MGSSNTHTPDPALDYAALARDIKRWGMELGFQQVGISDIRLDKDEAWLLQWLQAGYHGEMDYMQRHGTRRSRPAELVPGTVSVISVRMDYWPDAARAVGEVLDDAALAYLSRYALGRDYHKVMRKRLQQLATKIESVSGAFGYRAFTDSAPVLEKALAQQAGLGWIGKHTNLINERAGSWFFIGELYTNLPLPLDTHALNRCGSCQNCIDACPTQAIIAPYQLDARLCISYLTIELRSSIPEPLRALIGNRVYGCDDCQLVCPWNRFAGPSAEEDFTPRHGLDSSELLCLFQWDEKEFAEKTCGSAIHRIGYACWLRNIAVGLGNAPTSDAVVNALRARQDHPSELVREHVAWALRQHLHTR
ncbi:MAG: tRNA epoxyqueuosine(34) reductase QueG [Gammaproteobacteria bacterium]|jgi:epoxyqueuosine reductase